MGWRRGALVLLPVRACRMLTTCPRPMLLLLLPPLLLLNTECRCNKE